jgi:hypothetical protein
MCNDVTELNLAVGHPLKQFIDVLLHRNLSEIERYALVKNLTEQELIIGYFVNANQPRFRRDAARLPSF